MCIVPHVDSSAGSKYAAERVIARETDSHSTLTVVKHQKHSRKSQDSFYEVKHDLTSRIGCRTNNLAASQHNAVALPSHGDNRAGDNVVNKWAKERPASEWKRHGPLGATGTGQL